MKTLNWRGRRRLEGDLTDFVAGLNVFTKDILFPDLPPFAQAIKEDSNETIEYDNHARGVHY